MHPKQRALVWTAGLIVISAVLAWLSWSRGSGREGFLGIVLVLLAVVFGILSLTAAACTIAIAQAPESRFEKKRKRGASRKGATTGGGDAAPLFDGLPGADASSGVGEAGPGGPPAHLPGATKKPRPVAKKAGGSTESQRPALSPALQTVAAKKPRPVNRPKPDEGPDAVALEDGEAIEEVGEIVNVEPAGDGPSDDGPIDEWPGIIEDAS